MVEPSSEHDRVAQQVVDSAFAVHTTLGPGLLESVYEQCLTAELRTRNLSVERQVALPIVYRNTRIEAGLRMDMVVEGLVVVEAKAVETILPIHEAQLLTYLKLSGLQLGLLINFNVTLIKNGIRRLVRTY
jgi:GxxExxY protein